MSDEKQYTNTDMLNAFLGGTEYTRKYPNWEKKRSQAYIEWLEKHTARKLNIEILLVARKIITDKHPKKVKVDTTGTVECPRCKDELHYRISGYNQHIWGKCKTEKCLSWME